MTHAEAVRVLRMVLIIAGILFVVFAFFRLNARQPDRTGLCGSIVQGSTHDDGGSSTPDCNRLRHQDGVDATVFAIIGVATGGIGVSLTFHARRR